MYGPTSQKGTSDDEKTHSLQQDMSFVDQVFQSDR